VSLPPLRPQLAGPAPGTSRPAGTLAAFAELRMRLLWRRLRGQSGVPELVARVVLWMLVLPLGFVMAGGTGLAAWRGVRAGSGLETNLATTTLFFGVWTAWTAMALTVTEREAVDLRRFLVYPVPPWKLSAYGLAASVVGDPFAAFWCLMLGGAFVGAAIARPGAWLLLLLLTMALFVGTVVALVAALHEVLARLMRSRRDKALGVAAVYAGTIALVAWGTSGSRSFWEVFRLFGFVKWAAYPPALAGRAANLLYRSRPAEALPWIAALAAAFLVTAWVAHRLALSAALSGEGGSQRASGAGDRGWRIPGRLGGLLEKEGKYLLRNPLAGVLALIVPGMAALVAWKVGPRIPVEAGEVIRVVPLLAFALYAHLVSEVFYLNAFGWERGGGRLWFLAPVAPADVLLAKNLVAYAFSLVLFAMCLAALLVLGGAPPAWGLWAGALLHLGAAPWLSGVGNFVSVLNPRAIPFDVQRGGSLSPLSALAGVAILSGVAGLFGVPALLAIKLDSPALLLASWAVVGLAGAAAYRVALPHAARLLVRRREAVVDAVAGDDLQ